MVGLSDDVLLIDCDERVESGLNMTIITPDLRLGSKHLQNQGKDRGAR